MDHERRQGGIGQKWLLSQIRIAILALLHLFRPFRGLPKSMKVILDAETISSVLASLADQVLLDTDNAASLAVVGIRSRGEVLAERLTRLLADRYQERIPCGTLDITLYRDDLNSPRGNGQPPQAGRP